MRKGNSKAAVCLLISTLITIRQQLDVNAGVQFYC